MLLAPESNRKRTAIYLAAIGVFELILMMQNLASQTTSVIVVSAIVFLLVHLTDSRQDELDDGSTDRVRCHLGRNFPARLSQMGIEQLVGWRGEMRDLVSGDASETTSQPYIIPIMIYDGRTMRRSKMAVISFNKTPPSKKNFMLIKAVPKPRPKELHNYQSVAPPPEMIRPSAKFPKMPPWIKKLRKKARAEAEGEGEPQPDEVKNYVDPMPEFAPARDDESVVASTQQQVGRDDEQTDDATASALNAPDVAESVNITARPKDEVAFEAFSEAGSSLIVLNPEFDGSDSDRDPTFDPEKEIKTGVMEVTLKVDKKSGQQLIGLNRQIVKLPRCEYSSEDGSDLDLQ